MEVGVARGEDGEVRGSTDEIDAAAVGEIKGGGVILEEIGEVSGVVEVDVEAGIGVSWVGFGAGEFGIERSGTTLAVDGEIVGGS